MWETAVIGGIAGSEDARMQIDVQPLRQRFTRAPTANAYNRTAIGLIDG